MKYTIQWAFFILFTSLFMFIKKITGVFFKNQFDIYIYIYIYIYII